MSVEPAPVVLVTGGAGFVGSVVVQRLVARGRRTHVFARRATRPPGLAALDLHWHVGELEDESSFRAALGRASEAARELGAALDVVHLAGRISYRQEDRELLRRANVDGTRVVLATARTVPVRRLCHVSSVVALGAAADVRHELDDDAPLAGLQLESAYARTKAAAEELVQAASGALDVVVASPAVVFGVSPAGSNSAHFLGRVARGSLGPLSPPGSLSVVGLEDAAEGILLALERGVRGRRYLLSESTWTLHELLTLASRCAGRRAPLARIPPGVWSAFVAFYGLVDRLAHSERATPEALELFGHHFRFRARRAREELGWNPRPIADVLREVLAWMRERDPR